eukprot:GILI01013688.1.p1 GENE.GILI01013688.1~~GILI01013688.1.p1  ORF type:complete len:188 (-),score=22.14 GILI01013688.1:165-728(-)
MPHPKHVTIESDLADEDSHRVHHRPRPPSHLEREIESASLAVGMGNSFLIKADEAFKDTHQRGKKPRFDGFSMRHWNDQTKQKYQKNAMVGGGVSEHTDRDEASLAMRLPPMTEAEIRAHDEADSLWMVVRGIVYDCTAWQRFHPGGEAILRACGGRDASEVYDFYHKWVDCAGLMAAYAVGRLVKE